MSFLDPGASEMNMNLILGEEQVMEPQGSQGPVGCRDFHSSGRDFEGLKVRASHKDLLQNRESFLVFRANKTWQRHLRWLVVSCICFIIPDVEGDPWLMRLLRRPR